MSHFPLYTERLKMRPVNETDLVRFVEIFTKPLVMKFSKNGPMNAEQAESYLKRLMRINEIQPAGMHAVFLKQSEEFIGVCGFYHQIVDNEEEVEIGYRFDPDFWGKGYATEAACACRDFGFSVLKVPRLISIIQKENVASIGVAKRMGMVLEKETTFMGFNVQVFSITKSEGICPS